RARARRDAAARKHARRGTPGGFSAEPVAALRGPWLLADRVRAANDPRRNRQLPRPEARNCQPGAVAVRAGKSDRRQPETRADPESGRIAPDRLRSDERVI